MKSAPCLVQAGRWVASGLARGVLCTPPGPSGDGHPSVEKAVPECAARAHCGQLPRPPLRCFLFLLSDHSPGAVGGVESQHRRLVSLPLAPDSLCAVGTVTSCGRPPLRHPQPRPAAVVSCPGVSCSASSGGPLGGEGGIRAEMTAASLWLSPLQALPLPTTGLRSPVHRERTPEWEPEARPLLAVWPWADHQPL